MRKGRESVFLFGTDTCEELLLQKSPYEVLKHLGFSDEHIHFEVWA